MSYKTIKLTKEDKERLATTEELNPDGECYYDLDCDWFISNDPNFDSISDGRVLVDGKLVNKMEDGNDYPFPYVLMFSQCKPECSYDAYSEHFMISNNLLHYFKEDQENSQ